jgi:diguanylate cyclase (GGDEF)-like protein
VASVIAAWDELSALERSGSLYVIGDDEAHIRMNARLADRVSRSLTAADAGLDDLWELELSRQRDVSARAQERRDSAVALFAIVVIAGLISAVGVVVLLIRNVVPRLRRYSRFATGVGEGQLSTRLEPSGHDELSDLGRRLDEMVARLAALREREEAEIEFAAALQIAESEGEAHDLLRRQLERSIPGGSVVVFNRNNSVNRLEAVTPVAEDSCLNDRLTGAAPRSCLAIRSGQLHENSRDRQQLVSCQLCAAAAGATMCRPLLVGGEVIGSALVEHPQDLTDQHAHTLRQSVSQAAPVLSNLRSLAIAEIRAATDALTGLANARAGQETLKRMTAQASRTGMPLAAVMLDLDHFKQLNDQYGHGIGDDVLAAVGATLRSCVREGDFVGRYGGEEFMLLLPETNAHGALVVTEEIRLAIAEITVSGVERDITASLGVAVLPDNARDATTLIRNADRALYSAKHSGRNRVQLFDGEKHDGAPSTDTEIFYDPIVVEPSTAGS